MTFFLLFSLGSCSFLDHHSFEKLSIGVYAPDQQSLHLKAIKRVLVTFGIPFRISQSLRPLMRHPAIVVAGPAPEYRLSKNELQLLYHYAEKGGTLLLAGEIGMSLYALIGAEKIVPKTTRFSITVTGPIRDSILHYVNQPEEALWRLGNPEIYKEIGWTFGSIPRGAVILARFDDSVPALTRFQYNAGAVYYLGVGWDNAILLPQTGKDYEAQGQWVNAFEPTTDMFMLLIKALYEKSVYPNFYFGITPGTSKTALLLSHDIDARTSFANALTYAHIEKQLGVKSTFFVCTKYFTDENDTSYFNPVTLRYIDSLHLLGFSIGSHSVSHAANFGSLPEGAALVKPQTYRPGDKKTIWGEVQVSKWILEKSGLPVTAFRSGYLAVPPGLIRILQQNGYQINSSLSANDIMCNFPFFALETRRLDSRETDIMELPVTLDCSRGHLTEKNAEAVIRSWNSIIAKNMENNAITVLLIHPNIASYKLWSEKELIMRIQSPDVWMGDIETYASFFRARSSIRVLDASFNRQTLNLFLNIPYHEIPEGFSIIVNGFPDVKKIVIRDVNMVQLTSNQKLENNRWTTFACAKDQVFYEFQRKLVLIILALFSMIIGSLSLFFLIQRVYLSLKKGTAASLEHDKIVTEILFSEIPVEAKVAKLKAAGKLSDIRNRIVDNLDFIKGEMSFELSSLYTALGFYHADLKRLKSRKWWVRAKTARLLSTVHIPEAAGHIVPLLNDRKEEVRIAAAFTLSHYNNKEIISLLVKTIQKSDRWTAELLVTYLMPLRREAARVCAEIAQNKSWSLVARLAAIETLGNLKDTQSVPLLLLLLESTITDSSPRALSSEELLKYLTGEKTVVLDQTALAYVQTILKALGKIGDDTMVPALGELLTNPCEEVRLHVCDTIAQIGNPQILPQLQKALQHTTITCAATIIRTIASLGDKGTEGLFSLLKDNREFIVRMALQQLEESNYVEDLVRILKSTAEDMKPKARRLLGRIMKTGFKNHLVDLFSRPEYQSLLDNHNIPGDEPSV